MRAATTATGSALSGSATASTARSSPLHGQVDGRLALLRQGFGPLPQRRDIDPLSLS